MWAQRGRDQRALCAALACFEVQVVAIERSDGLLVDRLLESGVRVLALLPNQVKAVRERESDRLDCFVLCELARTDARRFRIPLAGRSARRVSRDSSLVGWPRPEAARLGRRVLERVRVGSPFGHRSAAR